MADGKKQVSVERVITAPPEKIFDVLADPAQHAVIDGSGTVQHARGNSIRLTLGAKFGMSMRLGLPYPVTNTVVEFDENRRIAWRHMGRHRWRYELQPIESGTRVTETFDWNGAPLGWLYELTGLPARHKPNMEGTLERLDDLVTGGAAPA